MFKIKDYLNKEYEVYAVHRELWTEKDDQSCYGQEYEATDFLIYDGRWKWIDADNCIPIKQ